jgi:hypothetical protein
MTNPNHPTPATGEQATGGAIDIETCVTRTRTGSCRCLPKCICGYGPHSALHGPFYGQQPGTKPYDHEYQARKK